MAGKKFFQLNPRSHISKPGHWQRINRIGKPVLRAPEHGRGAGSGHTATAGRGGSCRQSWVM